MNLAPILNQILGIFTIFTQVLIVFLGIFLITKKPSFFQLSSKKAFFLAFIVALTSAIGSLIYSNVIGYDPCELCWLQRTMMYPQVIILGMVLLKKDYKMGDYSIALSIVGALIAGYQYLLQIGVASVIPCSAIQNSVQCSERFVLQYGYITIPMMALSAFVLIIFLLLALKLKSSSPNKVR